MIAIALAGAPRLLIADEPTTALDVTIQAQVLDLLDDLRRKQGMALLLITHDLGVVARMADRVGVMYAGQLVEEAPRGQFFSRPAHPYSVRLFAALPDAERRGGRLATIPGSVPPADARHEGCRFVDRCGEAMPVCRTELPPWRDVDARQRVRCHLPAPRPRWQGEKSAPVTRRLRRPRSPCWRSATSRCISRSGAASCSASSAPCARSTACRCN
jgi:peptide/nickel transport system ATP-binding protein